MGFGTISLDIAVLAAVAGFAWWVATRGAKRAAALADFLTDRLNKYRNKCECGRELILVPIQSMKGAIGHWRRCDHCRKMWMDTPGEPLKEARYDPTAQ